MNETGNRQLELLSTEHCSLCDRAFEMLMAAPSLAGWGLRVKDIVNDDDLLSEYGERIPVLRYQNQRLCWPFDINEVNAWLRGLG